MYITAFLGTDNCKNLTVCSNIQRSNKCQRSEVTVRGKRLAGVAALSEGLVVQALRHVKLLALRLHTSTLDRKEESVIMFALSCSKKTN